VGKQGILVAVVADVVHLVLVAAFYSLSFALFFVQNVYDRLLVASDLCRVLCAFVLYEDDIVVCFRLA